MSKCPDGVTFCPDEELLAAFLEGALPTDASASMDEHLDRCARCRTLVAQLAPLACPLPPGEVNGAAPHPAPEGLCQLPGPGDVVGRYELIEHVGTGGGGVVYIARDAQLDRRVALKLLSPTRRLASSPLREATLMARLNHPNVVTVHDSGMLGERAYVAMELVEGENLRAWLSSAPRTAGEILGILTQAATGLAAIHACGLVHGDFKPENVLVGRDGRARVADFGLADAHGEAAVGGTRAYLAPEQRITGRLDPGSDQYSFFVTLREALEHQRGAWRPRWLRSMLRKGLSFEPAERFQSMAEVAARLRDAPQRTKKALRWGAVLTTGAAAAALVLSLASIREQTCRRVGEDWARVWNPERARALRAQFAQSAWPFAADASAEIERVLDERGKQWVLRQTEACEAGNARRGWPESVRIYRQRCLERVLGETDALLTQLERLDQRTVRNAVAALGELSSVSSCVDLDGLSLAAVGTGHESEAARAAREGLPEVDALVWVGRFEEARQKAEERLESFKASQDRAALAILQSSLGLILIRLGKATEAEPFLKHAVSNAEAVGNARIAAESWTTLAFLAGYLQGRTEWGEHFAERAEAALARVGKDAALEARLKMAAASIASRQQRYADALAIYPEAVSLLERAFGPRSLRLAKLYNNYGADALMSGDQATAERCLSEALAIKREKLGAAHPDVAFSLVNHGEFLSRIGRDAEALAAFEEAERLHERLNSPLIDRLYLSLNRAETLRGQKKREEAAQVAGEALARAGNSLPTADSSVLVHLYMAKAYALLELGRARPAIPLVKEALALTNRGVPSDMSASHIQSVLADARRAVRRERR